MDVVEIIQPIWPESIIVKEWDALYSRTDRVVAQNAVIPQFGVYGLLNGKAVPINFAANDGSQNAAGVALAAVAPVGADGDVAGIENGPVLLRQDLLQWPAGATQLQIAGAIAQLNAIGVKSVITG